MSFLDEYRPKVETEIKSCLGMGGTGVLDLNTMYCYHMGFCDRDGNPSDSSKGKYLRPLFCIAMCAGLGSDPEQAIPAAAALELTHRTSLIFDDIQDKGKERNNQPTVWSIWGADQAINAGLALSCHARLALHRLSLRNVPNEKVLGIQSVLENAVIEVCQGQFMDISFVDSLSVGVEDYLRMVRGKTATLFATSCAVGAMLATTQEDVVTLAREFGMSMGMAFQMQDDYLGIWGDEAIVGKTANDILERKRTLPLILAMNKDPGWARYWLGLEYIGKRRVRGWTAWMEREGIKDQVKKLEARYIRKARASLKALPLQKEWQDQFEEVLQFLSEREL